MLFSNGGPGTRKRVTGFTRNGVGFFQTSWAWRLLGGFQVSLRRHHQADDTEMPHNDYILHMSAKSKIIMISAQIKWCQFLDMCDVLIRRLLCQMLGDVVPNLALVHIIQQCFISPLHRGCGHMLLCSFRYLIFNHLEPPPLQKRLNLFLMMPLDNNLLRQGINLHVLILLAQPRPQLVPQRLQISRDLPHRGEV